MNANPRELIEAQMHFGLADVAPVEKDLQVAQVIKTVSRIDASPFRLVFGGGTALARAHRLIRRMSEDVDFKIVAPKGFSQSRSKLRGLLGALRDQVTHELNEAGFSSDIKPRARNENRYLAYDLPYATTAPEGRGLRSTVQLELTYAPLRLPPVHASVSSFVAEAFGRPPEAERVLCVSLAETAAEKLVALTRRTAMVLAAAVDNPYDDHTLIRHVYDLHILSLHCDTREVVDLASGIVRYDANVFVNQYPAFRDNPMSEIRKSVSALESDPMHARRYRSFERDMVYGERIPFPTALASVKKLVNLLS